MPRLDSDAQERLHDTASAAVVIVNHNTRDELRACLTTVRASGARDVVVVDNASRDESTDMLRAEFPSIRVIANERNVGYGAAANIGIASCDAEYVLLLNSDTDLRPGALAGLSDYLDRHPQVAIVGPLMIRPDGSLQPSCFPEPTPLALLLRESTLGSLVGRIPALRNHYLPTWAHDRPRSVPWVLGAALAIRRRAFQEVGGFDEAFFMYSEEVDLCHRLRGAGWRIDFAPVAAVIHAGAASTGQYRVQMAAQLYASQLLFARRHLSASQRWQVHWIVRYVMYRNLIVDWLRARAAADPAQRTMAAENLVAWGSVLAALHQEH